MKSIYLIFAIAVSLFMYNCGDDSTSNTSVVEEKIDSTLFDFYELPAGDTTNGIFLRITGALADPMGVDSVVGEEIYVKNFGKTQLNLANFKVMDKQNTTWEFADYGFTTIDPNQSITIKSKKGAQLANGTNGDELKLAGTDGFIYQSYSYIDVQETEGNPIVIPNVKIKILKKK
jgi:hypothetical protein